MDLLLTKYLKAVISYEGIQRVETYPVPVDALREAVLNAIIHRNYGIPAPIQIRVYADRLYIWNPGELPEDWSVEKLLGQHASQPFNPDIANAFFWAGEIESWGRGIQRILGACRLEGVPEPDLRVDPRELWIEFPFSDTYLHSLDSASGKTTETSTETSTEKILSLLRKNPEMTVKELATHTGITYSGARYHIEKLRRDGHIRRAGPTREGCWEIVGSESSKTTGNTSTKTSTETSTETSREKILSLLCKNPEMTVRELATHAGITYSGARYHIESLKKQGYLRRDKSTKAGHWEIVDGNPE